MKDKFSIDKNGILNPLGNFAKITEFLALKALLDILYL